jgi:hypothetical protein
MFLDSRQSHCAIRTGAGQHNAKKPVCDGLRLSWSLITGRGLAMLGWGISAIIVAPNIKLPAVAVL